MLETNVFIHMQNHLVIHVPSENILIQFDVCILSVNGSISNLFVRINSNREKTYELALLNEDCAPQIVLHEDLTLCKVCTNVACSVHVQFSLFN